MVFPAIQDIIYKPEYGQIWVEVGSTEWMPDKGWIGMSLQANTGNWIDLPLQSMGGLNALRKVFPFEVQQYVGTNKRYLVRVSIWDTVPYPSMNDPESHRVGSAEKYFTFVSAPDIGTPGIGIPDIDLPGIIPGKVDVLPWAIIGIGLIVAAFLVFRPK